MHRKSRHGHSTITRGAGIDNHYRRNCGGENYDPISNRR
ncbi:hypothetical protein NSERUTF1_6860 [Nocardia seriolae]|nr:hypothetical protein NSERUTF1_6860 [Nocardia seriolae]